jgi:hypothetical protein
MKSKHGSYRQRVGKLIEEYICSKYNLFYNKRQHTQGYYDAYDNKCLYEIKGSINTSNRFFIRSINHESLVAMDGKYIFVIYELIDTDKDLKLITDIKINNIVFVSAKKLNEVVINSKKEYFNKYVNKFYYRITYNDILKITEVVNGL